VQPVVDVFGSVSRRDLGGVVKEINALVQELDPKPHWVRQLAGAMGLTDLLDKFELFRTPESKMPRGSYIVLRGQAETMRSSYIGLGLGLIVAIALIYLLLVVNFQSWLDPFIIITALPGALAGVLWALYLTFTTMSVPALMGAIMSLGVATANSVLVVSFARTSLRAGVAPSDAALEAGVTRLRAVLMTALAMVIGMLPLSLGLGEGGEQNAPLGRAVIGGLVFATIATLFFVPVVFSLLHRRQSPNAIHEHPELEITSDTLPA
jgi:multidrug efflux pump subunit AcrB